MVKKLEPVKVVQDYSGHWYVLPTKVVGEFYRDLESEETVDSEEFDKKYGEFRVGGDLNLVQLYAFI